MVGSDRRGSRRTSKGWLPAPATSVEAKGLLSSSHPCSEPSRWAAGKLSPTTCRFVMTENANLKRRVRARAAKTGESYTAARRHVLSVDQAEPRRVVIATAQSVLRPDPRSRDQLRASGMGIRAAMRDASQAGASLAPGQDRARRRRSSALSTSRGRSRLACRCRRSRADPGKCPCRCPRAPRQRASTSGASAESRAAARRLSPLLPRQR
jgi:hypothetical protein